MSSNLNERAMLVDLSIGFWEGRRKDKRVTKDTLVGARAEQDAGTWWTRILPPRMFRNILSAMDKGRMVLNRYTMPWTDGGMRIQPSATFLVCSQDLREARAQYEAAVDEFCAQYPDEIARAAERLGDLYDKDSFPKVSKIRSKFYWDLRVYPLPTTADFRVDLGNEETERVKKEMEDRLTSMIQTSSQDLWRRLYEVCEKVSERLADPKKVFRNSLITHVIELCDLLPRLNVLGDPKLEEMRQEVIKKIAGHKPDDLRSEPSHRNKAAMAAADIMDRMKGYLPKE